MEDRYRRGMEGIEGSEGRKKVRVVGRGMKGLEGTTLTPVFWGSAKRSAKS